VRAKPVPVIRKVSLTVIVRAFLVREREREFMRCNHSRILP
jgi:hypothetical protein